MTLELTEREIAIAKGENPDAPVETPEVESQVESQVENTEVATEGEPTEAVEQDAGQEVQDAGRDAQPRDWVDEDAKSVAKSYGLSEDDLKSFASKDEFVRFSAFFDKQLTKKEPVAEAPKPEAKSESKTATQEEDYSIDLDRLRNEGYDEETLRIARAAKKAFEENKALMERLSPLESNFKQIQEHYDRQIAQQRAEAFHTEVDSLNPDLFGRARDESGRFRALDGKFSENRKRLYEAAETIVHGITRRAELQGVAPELPSPRVILQRAMNLQFAEDIAKAERAKIQGQLKSQSARRRPVGTSKAASPSSNPGADPVKSITNDPSIVAAWNKFTQENGTE